MIVCKNCSAANRISATYCSTCGYRLKTMALSTPQVNPYRQSTTEPLNPFLPAAFSPGMAYITCPKCNFVNPESAKFCRGCGISLFRSLPQGTIVGDYVIEERIGVGGIGAVYRSRHRLLNLVVAIKVHDYFPEDEQVGMAFREAANYLSQLRHPNIVQLYEYGFQSGHAFLAMEYINGPNFSGLIPPQQTKHWLNDCLDYFAQLLDALHYAHTCPYRDLDGQPMNGIIHGDIKPQNIFLDRGSAKLTDFMIPDVQRLLGKENLKFTKANTDAFGTPTYMAPEQRAGVLNPLNDIYSLGATMYELITGNLPGSAAEYRHPRRVNPYVPEWLDNIIAKALEFYPSDRYQSVSDMIISFEEGRSSEKVSLVIQAKELFMGDKVEGNKPSYSIGDISNSTVSGLVQGENNNVISKLNDAGKSDLALALRTLTDAIVASKYLPADQKDDQVKIINQMGEEAAKPQPNRTLLKILGDGLLATLKAIPDIAPAIASVAPLLVHLL
jgi:serine/threonine protein kinase